MSISRITRQQQSSQEANEIEEAISIRKLDKLKFDSPYNSVLFCLHVQETNHRCSSIWSETLPEEDFVKNRFECIR